MVNLISGWQHLKKDEYDQIWDRFEERFQFRASMDPAAWPGIVEPTPSLTWDLTTSPPGVFGDTLNSLIMNALRDFTPADEWIYVLDWQHPAYRCWPHRMDPRLPTDKWLVPIIPNGDYSIFVGRDLSFGTFGHPWEDTICLWGADLINAIEARVSGVLASPCRRDGQPISHADPPTGGGR